MVGKERIDVRFVRALWSIDTLFQFLERGWLSVYHIFHFFLYDLNISQCLKVRAFHIFHILCYLPDDFVIMLTTKFIFSFWVKFQCSFPHRYYYSVIKKKCDGLEMSGVSQVPLRHIEAVKRFLIFFLHIKLDLGKPLIKSDKKCDLMGSI